MADDQIDDEARELASLRELIRRADPPPPEVAAVAQIAYELRDVAVVGDDVGELVGVRSVDMGSLHRIANGDSVLAWRVEDRRVVGVVGPATAQMSCVLATSETLDQPIDSSGAFELAQPEGPWRLEVRSEGQTWATEWQPGAR